MFETLFKCIYGLQYAFNLTSCLACFNLLFLLSLIIMIQCRFGCASIHLDILNFNWKDVFLFWQRGSLIFSPISYLSFPLVLASRNNCAQYDDKHFKRSKWQHFSLDGEKMLKVYRWGNLSTLLLINWAQWMMESPRWEGTSPMPLALDKWCTHGKQLQPQLLSGVACSAFSGFPKLI